MPGTRPSNKGKDNADWWRNQLDEKGEVPDGSTANHAGGSGKNKFD